MSSFCFLLITLCKKNLPMIIACVHTFFFKHVNFANFSDINLRELICKIYHVRANKMYTALIFSNFSTSNHGIFLL